MCASGDGDGRVDGLHGFSGAFLVGGDGSPSAAHAAAAGGDAPHPQAGLADGPRGLLVETIGPPAIQQSPQKKAVTKPIDSLPRKRCICSGRELLVSQGWSTAVDSSAFAGRYEALTGAREAESSRLVVFGSCFGA